MELMYLLKLQGNPSYNFVGNTLLRYIHDSPMLTTDIMNPYCFRAQTVGFTKLPW